MAHKVSAWNLEIETQVTWLFCLNCKINPFGHQLSILKKTVLRLSNTWIPIKMQKLFPSSFAIQVHSGGKWEQCNPGSRRSSTNLMFREQGHLRDASYGVCQPHTCVTFHSFHGISAFPLWSLPAVGTGGASISLYFAKKKALTEVTWLVIKKGSQQCELTYSSLNGMAKAINF